MSDKKLVLAINPGSTSTKIGVYRGLEALWEKTLRHSAGELDAYPNLFDQFDFRKEAVLASLREGGIDIRDIAVIMGRGGLLRPVKSGVFAINDAMIHDLKAGIGGVHASNLGGLIAHELTLSLPGARAYTVDPIVVDELEDVARVSGHPLFERISIFHALNQKATARMHAEKTGGRYEEMNLIVAHLGGGISVGAHRRGHVIDVNQALSGEGPFSPERSGTLPAGALADLCFSGKYTHEEVKKMITGKGGFVAYLGTNNAAEVEEKTASGDAAFSLVRNALVYQIAKEIGTMAAVLEGKIDAILITGGIAYSETFTADLRAKIGFLAPVYVYPGENEIFALAYNGYRILQGKAEIMEYEKFDGSREDVLSLVAWRKRIMDLVHSAVPREFLDVMPEGIIYMTRQGKDFLVVRNVFCPEGHSLMADDVHIHGEPSVSLCVEIAGQKGNFFVDAFWGSHKKLCDFFPPPGAVVDAFCPVCGKSLMVEETCAEAGCGTGKHIQLLLPGGKNRVLVCGRLGCSGHRLDIKDVSGQIVKKLNEINFSGTQIEDYYGGI